MTSPPICMSAIITTGDAKFLRSQAFEALKSQTIATRMEVVILQYVQDGRTDDPCPPEAGPAVREIAMERGDSFASARCKGIQHARGVVVAILEDHCIPEPDWAQQLLEAHGESKRVVGYAFTNGSPDTYCYRSFFLAEYGMWMHPASKGPVDNLPGNNVSYKREDLMTLQDAQSLPLAQILSSPECLREWGFDLILEPKVQVAHQSYRNLTDVFRAHYQYCRLLGGTRVEQGTWGACRRGAYALAVPLLVPALQVLRIFRRLRGASQRARFDSLSTIPLIYCFYQVAAFGESCGYLWGKGSAEELLDSLELNAARIGNRP